MNPCNADAADARPPSTGPFVAGMAFAWVLLAAFSPGADAAGQTVSLNQGGKDVRIAVGEAAVLPADFPKDIALPEPRTLVRVQRSGEVATVELETPGTVDDADAKFRAAMLEAGWTAAAVQPPLSGRAQAWVKDRRAVVAWLAPAVAGGVRLQLELLPKP
jgi:hypothetical protein